MTDTHTTAYIPDEAVQAAQIKFAEVSDYHATSKDMRDAISAALPNLSAPCAVEAIRFGKGEICVSTGEYYGDPAVCIYPSKSIGIVGANVPKDQQRGEGDLTAGELAFTFPTHEQAKIVADALCNVVTKPVDVAAVREQAFEEALQAIKSIPTPMYVETINGHEDAYRAVEALTSAEPAQGDQSGRAAMAQEVESG